MSMIQAEDPISRSSLRRTEQLGQFAGVFGGFHERSRAALHVSKEVTWCGATFLETIEEPMRGRESTVPVVSRRA